MVMQFYRNLHGAFKLAARFRQEGVFRTYCVSPLRQEENLPHTPVMSNEVVMFLLPEHGKTYIDMTFGAGGHSKLLLKTCPHIRLFGLDRDPEVLKYARELQDMYPDSFTPLLGKFSDLPSLLREHCVKPGTVDGILFDFGCSSMQFDQGERGFSINHDGPLDMRMNNNPDNSEPTAAELLAVIREDQLAKILHIYGEEKQARKIARVITRARQNNIRLETTHDLKDIVAAACDDDNLEDKQKRHAHSATKVFQALRIFINNELNEINYAMILAHQYLRVNGRMVTLSFHSLEDTIVKRHIAGNVIDSVANPLPLKYVDTSKSYSPDEYDTLKETGWKQINKHVLTPSAAEVLVNHRSRSAKLRAAVKTH